jgi:hypothetical protein
MDGEQDLYEHETDYEIEGYCMRCRESVVIDEPQPVWTRRGMPATRGDCPTCGGTVFRMGMTDLHNPEARPDAVNVAGAKRPKLARETVYISYAPTDEALAAQIGADLEKIGIASWLHEHEGDAVQWAGGVHPALAECARMVLVLSPAALDDDSVNAALAFFKEKRKPIVIAQVAPGDPPAEVRRSPRFDFTGDYKTAFRQMIGALSA